MANEVTFIIDVELGHPYPCFAQRYVNCIFELRAICAPTRVRDWRRTSVDHREECVDLILVIQDAQIAIRVKIRKSDFYALGNSRGQNGQWRHCDDNENYFIGSVAAGYGCRYGDTDFDSRETIGPVALLNAVSNLWHGNGDQKFSFITIVISICEACRFDNLKTQITWNIVQNPHGPDRLFTEELKEILRNWSRISKEAQGYVERILLQPLPDDEILNSTPFGEISLSLNNLTMRQALAALAVIHWK